MSAKPLTRVPSQKARKQPEIRHTKTSLARMLNANPDLSLNQPQIRLPQKKRVVLQELPSYKKREGQLELPLQPANRSRRDKSTTTEKPPFKKREVLPKLDAQKKQEVPHKKREVLQELPLQPENRSRRDKSSNTEKPKRRSLSAAHYEEKQKADLKGIPEIVETEHVFKTPQAHYRRSVLPNGSTLKRSFSASRISTPTVEYLSQMKKRLNEWLIRRGKAVSHFHHLKCFDTQDEENKENIETEETLKNSSYEDLGIELPSKIVEPINYEKIAKSALENLHKLILEGYPSEYCETWLSMIHDKIGKIENEPEFWECRAAIEESRGNITEAVKCYQSAIVKGAEISKVDESLEQLLEKFSLLNIDSSESKTMGENTTKKRARLVKDARNIFKSAIIKFSVQERQAKNEGKTLYVTPVRRSTRVSRSRYTSTPGIALHSSFKELEHQDNVCFAKNKALL